MGKIVVSENVTLDGVVEDPTGQDGSPHGGWFTRIGEATREQWANAEVEEALAAEALLMGRLTYEWLVPRWAERPGEWADRLRALPKYVVTSSDLAGPDWANTTVIKSDEVTALKREVAGDIVVYGSRRLVGTLMADGLVDELRLMTFPFVIGAGERLFDGIAAPKLRLSATRTIGEAVVLLTYRIG